MRTTIYITTLALFILLSCSKETTLDSGGILFIISSDIKKTSHEVLTTNILQAIKEINFSELKEIEKIKIDTILFSYVFNIPYADTITQKTIDRFTGFGALLSDYKLNGKSIHINLTDSKFQPIKSLQFNRDSYQLIDNLYESNKISIVIDVSMPQFQPGGLSLILLNKVPSLFTGKDTVLLKIKMENENIKADFTVDLNQLAMDSLNKEFRNLDPLYFYGLFDNRNIYFQIRNKQDSELKIVYELKKLQKRT